MSIETLRLNVAIPQGTCCVCVKPPVAEALDMTLNVGGKEYDVTVCRHCLAEHAPEVLAMLER